VAAAINGMTSIELHRVAVSSSDGTVKFVTSTTNPSSGGMAGAGNIVIEVPTVTLDQEFPKPLHEPVLLLDVEGNELCALQGGRALVTRDRPLIIFEYNHVSRQHFTLESMQSLLGPEYEVYRLRTADGRLDRDFADTWNCVAVHRQTPYHQACLSLVAERRD